MDLDNDIVRSWKEYSPAGVSDSSPVSGIDLADTAQGGLMANTWWADSTYCCESSLGLCTF